MSVIQKPQMVDVETDPAIVSKFLHYKLVFKASEPDQKETTKKSPKVVPAFA